MSRVANRVGDDVVVLLVTLCTVRRVAYIENRSINAVPAIGTSALIKPCLDVANSI